MFHYVTSKKRESSYRKARSSHARFALPHIALLAAVLCCVMPGKARSQSKVPSHGKTKLDSYSKLLRDVHPASQAQANYLQNLLFLCGLKKAERLERQERIDVYAERQLIKALQNDVRVVKRLSAGSPMSVRSMTTFWALLSVFGDRAEVYDALSSEAPPLSHDQFVPTSQFIRVVRPDGELERPPFLLEGAEGLDASKLRNAWTIVARKLRANGRISAAEVEEFHNSVADYRKQCAPAMSNNSPSSGRLQARKFLTSLGTVADALYRPKQFAEIQQYIEHGGHSYNGGSMLGLIQHMLRNRVTPAAGSTAQVALAEVARPVSRVLEQEIALHYERIDSLAANEGHRPYAAEYRLHEEPIQAPLDTNITQTAPASQVSF